MTTAAAAAEYKANLGPEFTVAEAYDLDYLDADTEDERGGAAGSKHPHGRVVWHRLNGTCACGSAVEMARAQGSANFPKPS